MASPLPPWPFLVGGAPAVEVSSELDGDVLEVRYVTGDAPLVDGVLCVRRGDDGLEMVVPRACDGWVAAAGRVVTLAELRQCGVQAVPLGPRTVAVLQVGRARFRVSGTSPPVRAPLSPTVAWRRELALAAMGLVGCFFVAMFSGAARPYRVRRLALADTRFLRVSLSPPAFSAERGTRLGAPAERLPSPGATRATKIAARAAAATPKSATATAKPATAAANNSATATANNSATATANSSATAAATATATATAENSATATATATAENSATSAANNSATATANNSAFATANNSATADAASSASVAASRAGAIGVAAGRARSLVGARLAAYEARVGATESATGVAILRAHDAALAASPTADGAMSAMSGAAGGPSGGARSGGDAGGGASSAGGGSDGSGALNGSEVGDAYGTGGLGLDGMGEGGGGAGDTIGVGDIGTIGHGGGSGTGEGYGGARDFIGSHHAAAVPLARGATIEAGGTCPREAIRRTVRAHINEVRFCYERALQSRPALTGRVVASFVLASSGRVVRAESSESTIDPDVAACVTDAVRRWVFAGCDGGAAVSYPFVFVPSDVTRSAP
jgi:hypothetical protein